MKRTLEVYTLHLTNGKVKNFYQLGFEYGSKSIDVKNAIIASLAFSYPIFFNKKKFVFSLHKKMKEEVEIRAFTIENVFHLYNTYIKLLNEVRLSEQSSGVSFFDVTSNHIV
ncbi:hypothetical protein P7V44_21655 [Providencia sp. CRE-3FA-0001]|uniref:Uncharacterized protein n=1 Tax=Providencia huashanensis TaxID=3037798 RepID=A0AA42FLH2_9GAMM|nr:MULTISPECIES: hypothetical protein [unclassified Providencia]MDG4698833.1 hypothetical protein [Providencia sp. CRE-3FA-0001]